MQHGTICRQLFVQMSREAPALIPIKMAYTRFGTGTNYPVMKMIPTESS